eukprot:TRINITY_DN9846_c0_g1_i12.p1 TRINITY_DN9846_c0_g1~~TRINITY_DN9846_c0_g1_i12.p1  ORF type:complete len:116 (+),score=19.68 TRINITY_DN9846_c0_g1_i12:331-678(+)
MLFPSVKPNLSPKQQISSKRKQVLKERRFFSKKEASTPIKPTHKGMQDLTSSPLSNSLLSFLPFLFSISILFIYFILVALGHVQGFILKENFCEGEVVKMHFLMTNQEAFFAMAG